MNVYINKYIGTYSNSIYPQSYVGIKKKKKKNTTRLLGEIAENIIIFSLCHWVTLKYVETTVDFFVRREEIKMVKCGLKILD